MTVLARAPVAEGRIGAGQDIEPAAVALHIVSHDCADLAVGGRTQHLVELLPPGRIQDSGVKRLPHTAKQRVVVHAPPRMSSPAPEYPRIQTGRNTRRGQPAVLPRGRHGPYRPF